MSSFDDAERIANYADAPPRLVPGFAALQRMALILMRERAPAEANILVLGAGGGLELKVFAEAEPDWRFVGVDPSAEMLGLATKTAADFMARIDLHEGKIDTAPPGPFDAASCILTLHFLSVEERRQTLADLRARLKPGAPFVVAHHSISDGPGDRDLWLGRYADFATRSGVPGIDADRARMAIGRQLPILTPVEDAEMLTEAGFADVSLFYTGFTFRGWVGYA